MNEMFIKLGGMIGMNLLLFGLKKVAPKIPSFLAPIINLGLTMTGAYLGVITPTDAAVISGGSTIAHDVVKSVAKGDNLGDKTVVIKET